MLFPSNEGSGFLYNVGTYLSDCKTSHVKKTAFFFKKEWVKRNENNSEISNSPNRKHCSTQ